MDVIAIAAALGVFVVASPAFFIFGRNTGRRTERERQAAAKATAEETSKRIISEAERESENLRKSAVVAGKEELIKLRESFEVEVRGRREEVERDERRISEREGVLDRKFEVLEQRDKELGRRATEFGRREKTIGEREQEPVSWLIEIARRPEERQPRPCSRRCSNEHQAGCRIVGDHSEW